MYFRVTNLGFNFFITVLFTLLIAGSLVHSGMYFYYPSQFSWYTFLLVASFFICVSGIYLSATARKMDWRIPLPIVLFLMWGMYVFLHGLLLYQFNTKHIYLISVALFTFSVYILFKEYNYRINNLLWIICTAGLIESLICIAQFLGVTGSANSYFSVTGSLVNPNITAMFLVMCIPAALNKFFHIKNRIWYSVLLLAMLFSAILLLKCRTAYIGACLATFIPLNYRYNLTDRLINKSNRKAVVLMVIIASGILIPLAVNLYNSKKASADGRKLIWKLSLNMISEKPVTGYGYARFTHDYNIYQANYIQAGKASESQIENAGYVHMAYNEFLENTLEGGIPGLLIFSGLLLSFIFPLKKCSLLAKPSKASNTLAYNYKPYAHGAICAFAAMSIFNFTIKAVPVMCLFAIYLALFSSKQSYGQTVPKLNSIRTRNFNLLSGLVLSTLGLTILINQIIHTNAQIKNKKAAELIAAGSFVKGAKILTQINEVLNGSESYWVNCGNLAVATKQFSEAIFAFNQATKLTADPDLYYMLGKSYEKNGDLILAAQQYSTAKYIEPTRFKPRAALMNMHLRARNFESAIVFAKEIAQLKPKIKSEEVNRYKNRAVDVLKKLGVKNGRSKVSSEINFRPKNG
ncbi:MAG: O-antigen ligase family protein [Pyrinomonadaceae bacterium]|nr:O-antigen ligase family protein [Sphingobacteriaceae bacterium]